MPSPSTRSPRRGRKLALWAALSVGGVLPTVGCQVEYAGMTLPSGKYMHDDVQYFPPGPDFPYANTQAATQRARMQAMGLNVSEPTANPNGVALPPPAAGALDPGNANQSGGVPNVNVQLNPPGAGNPPAPGGAAPGGAAPGGAAPGANPPQPAPPGGDGSIDAMPR